MKFSKIKRAVKHYVTMKAARKKLGLHGKGKFMRQLKRSLHSFGSSAMPTSASTVSSDGYRYQGRTLSQLTGGA